MFADISSDLSGGVKDFQEDFAGIWLDMRVAHGLSELSVPLLPNPLIEARSERGWRQLADCRKTRACHA